MTSGGSSGSPVFEVSGNAIALNAGGNSRTSFYLPLDRVLRVLHLLQAKKTISRGTLQTIFRYLSYDEVLRLGLSNDTEKTVRTELPDETGMLVVKYRCYPLAALKELQSSH